MDGLAVANSVLKNEMWSFGSATKEVSDMSRTRIIVFVVAIVGIAMVTVLPAWAQTVAVCHIPPGNQDAARTITVGANSVAAHLSHGDFLGVCVGAAEQIEGFMSVTLCHIPPGNAAETHTITVGANSVAAHLSHGDTLGPCP